MMLNDYVTRPLPRTPKEKQTSYWFNLLLAHQRKKLRCVGQSFRLINRLLFRFLAVPPLQMNTKAITARNGEAEYLFHQILIYLDTDRVLELTEVEFNRAQIHSQLGNTESALKHLESALNMGWMETFSKEWWSLSNDHFLLPLREESEFQSLLNIHEMRKEELRQAITRNLNEMTGSV